MSFRKRILLALPFPQDELELKTWPPHLKMERSGWSIVFHHEALISDVELVHAFTHEK
jgi:hypothetical protein